MLESMQGSALRRDRDMEDSVSDPRELPGHVRNRYMYNHMAVLTLQEHSPAVQAPKPPGVSVSPSGPLSSGS